MAAHVCDACRDGDCLACTAVTEGVTLTMRRDHRASVVCRHSCFPRQVGKVDRRYRRVEPGQPYRIGGWHAGKPAA